MSQTTNPNGSGSAAATIELRTEYGALPEHGGTFRLLVRVVAPDVRDPQRQRPPLDLAFIVDRSGSMAGGGLEMAKRGVEHALQLLDERDTLSLTLFDNVVETPTPQRAFSTGTHRGVARRLAAYEPRGSTNLTEGWLRGCAQLAPIADGVSSLIRRTGKPVCRALLLTDGMANVGITDPHEITRHAAELQRRGITTTTFGVGEHFDEELLGRMADAGGGRYHYIARTSDIPRVFAGELGELLSMALRDVTLSLRTPSTWQVQLINDIPHSRHQHIVEVTLGEMSSNEERLLIWDIELPPLARGSWERLEANIRWRDVSGAVEQQASASLNLQAQSDPGPGDDHVLDIAAEIYAARARSDALRHNRAGDYSAARGALEKYLQSAPQSPAGLAMARELLDEIPVYSRIQAPDEMKQRHFSNRRTARQQRDHTSDPT